MYHAITATFAGVWWGIKTTAEMILFFIGQILLLIGTLFWWACVIAFYSFIGVFIASFVSMVFKLGGLF